MEETNVDKQVLSIIPVLFNYWAKAIDCLDTSRFFNDHIADTVSENSKNFIGIGTVPMQEPELAIKEMARCVKELNMHGVEIGTNINGKNLGDPAFIPFFESAESLNCAIFIHPWEMMGENQMQKYWLPWLVGMPAETTRAICSLIFSGTFEKFPRLRVAFAHGGGSFPYTLGRIQHGFYVRPDIVAIDNHRSPSEYLGKFWVDSLVHDKSSFKFLLEAVGENKICLGSDYPFPLGEQRPGELIEQMNLNSKMKEKLFASNALDWLNESSHSGLNT
jgi:aminocarboxymuconate-semialdehyde decarboxylase